MPHQQQFTPSDPQGPPYYPSQSQRNNNSTPPSDSMLSPFGMMNPYATDMNMNMNMMGAAAAYGAMGVGMVMNVNGMVPGPGSAPMDVNVNGAMNYHPHSLQQQQQQQQQHQQQHPHDYHSHNAHHSDHNHQAALLNYYHQGMGNMNMGGGGMENWGGGPGPNSHLHPVVSGMLGDRDGHGRGREHGSTANANANANAISPDIKHKNSDKHAKSNAKIRQHRNGAGGEIHTKGSNECDEEEAATALLMAGGRGPRSEDVEHMQAAVRERKLRMMQMKGRDRDRDRDRDRSSDGSATKKRKLLQQQQHNQHLSKDGKGDSKNKSGSSSRSSNEQRELKRRKAMEEMRKLLRREGSEGSSGSSSSSSMVIIKDFPSVLHEVLTKSEYSGTVLEWLHHGKSWRVLRWDELSDAVIPTYFPELCRRGSSSRSSGSGSSRDKKNNSDASDRMNMFIRQIKIWGFKEMREVGPDLGSFENEFFMKIAPKLVRHMSVRIVRKGSSSSSSRRTAESSSGSKIVSPPRRGPKGQFSVHSPPALNPGFNNIPEAFKVKRSVSSGDKRLPFTENREEVNGEVSSPGHRSGPRCVSFQERMDGDDSSIQSSGQRQIRPPFESPRSHQEMQLNYVSPNSITQWVGHAGEITPPQQSPPFRLKSNRGGSSSAQPSRVVESDDKQNRGGSYPVSNRGRGNKSVSSRGRSNKHKATRVDNTQETPMIIKKIENADRG